MLEDVPNGLFDCAGAGAGAGVLQPEEGAGVLPNPLEGAGVLPNPLEGPGVLPNPLEGAGVLPNVLLVITFEEDPKDNPGFSELLPPNGFDAAGDDTVDPPKP